MLKRFLVDIAVLVRFPLNRRGEGGRKLIENVRTVALLLKEAETKNEKN